MLRLVVFGMLALTAVTGAGWLYQAHHLVPLNFDSWSLLKAIRDLSVISVALLMLFYPSRVIVAVAMGAVFILPMFVSLNPPGALYVAAAAGCVVLAVLATQARRGIPSPFTTAKASSAD